MNEKVKTIRFLQYILIILVNIEHYKYFELQI